MVTADLSLVRIPLLWRLPGRVAAGAVLRDLAGHVDVVPTVLDLPYAGLRRDLQRQMLDALMETEDLLPPQIAFA